MYTTGIVSGRIADREDLEPPLRSPVWHVLSEITPVLEVSTLYTNGTIGVVGLRDPRGEQINQPLSLLQWLVARVVSQYVLLDLGKVERFRYYQTFKFFTGA